MSQYKYYFHGHRFPGGGGAGQVFAPLLDVCKRTKSEKEGNIEYNDTKN
jgi:hypothetical protein